MYCAIKTTKFENEQLRNENKLKDIVLQQKNITIAHLRTQMVNDTQLASYGIHYIIAKLYR